MTERTLDETTLKSWIGKTQASTDLIATSQARLLQATLDREPDLADGDVLPPLWHWTYFLTTARLSELGRDGHPKLGGFIPPVDLPRRMWAGGRLGFSAPVRLGEQITKSSEVIDVALKNGRSGTLCFITVRHQFSGTDGGQRFWEEHDIVYRQDPDQNAPPPSPPPAPDNAQHTRTISPSAVMLFRYSALTFNGHRIHYDRDYCRNVEGYPGLIFHGPFTATLLADFAVAVMPELRLKTFAFRAVSPLFDDAPFAIRAKPGEHDNTIEVWAETPQGALAMSAQATFSD